MQRVIREKISQSRFDSCHRARMVAKGAGSGSSRSLAFIESFSARHPAERLILLSNDRLVRSLRVAEYVNNTRRSRSIQMFRKKPASHAAECCSCFLPTMTIIRRTTAVVMSYNDFSNFLISLILDIASQSVHD